MSIVQPNKNAQAKAAEPTKNISRHDTEPTARKDRRPASPLAAKAPQQPPTAHGAPPTARNGHSRTTTQNGAGDNVSRRKESSSIQGNDDDLFSQLLGGENTYTPLSLFGSSLSDGASGFNPPIEGDTHSTSSAMTQWYPLEDALIMPLQSAGNEPMAMTLMLPKLGEVDARMMAMPPSGWDIALRFSPAAWSQMAPLHQYCQQSLKRRMACRVQLRFDCREYD